MWIIEIIELRTSPGSMPTSLPSGCRFQKHEEHEEDRTTGPDRWHRGRHFGKEVFAFLMMNEIVCNVLLFTHYEKI